jgi:hypothetical protein
MTYLNFIKIVRAVLQVYIGIAGRIIIKKKSADSFAIGTSLRSGLKIRYVTCMDVISVSLTTGYLI